MWDCGHWIHRWCDSRCHILSELSQHDHEGWEGLHRNLIAQLWLLCTTCKITKLMQACHANSANSSMEHISYMFPWAKTCSSLHTASSLDTPFKYILHTENQPGWPCYKYAVYSRHSIPSTILAGKSPAGAIKATLDSQKHENQMELN